jgi:hypothetical protein
MSKDDLIAELRAQGEGLASRVRALPADALEGGRYENGWNARQILAHVASIEWTYARLVDGARAAGGDAGGREAAPRPETAARPADAAADAAADAGAGAAGATASAGKQPDPSQGAPGSMIDDYNARQVTKRAEASVADLVAEFEKNRAATIAAVESADEALLAQPVRSAGGAQGTLAEVIRFVAVRHVDQHLRDILGEA